MNTRTIESICIFGSVARRSDDKISDKDVLIISNSLERRLELSCQWKAQGWSVSLYTPNRFLALLKAGSLFVQHLKHEGLIMLDKGNWLRRLLDFATPKKSYITDAKRSVLIALPMERFSRDMRMEDFGIITDLLYVSLRNFGINYLACNGVLEFDFENISYRIARDFSLRPRALDMLVQLRAGKSNFRRNNSYAGPCVSLGEIRSVIEPVFSFRPLQSIAPDSPVRELGSGYATLRDFEAAVVHKVGGNPSKDYLTKAGLEHLWSLVKSPQEYSWGVRNFGIKSLAVIERDGVDSETASDVSPELILPKPVARGGSLKLIRTLP